MKNYDEAVESNAVVIQLFKTGTIKHEITYLLREIETLEFSKFVNL